MVMSTYACVCVCVLHYEIDMFRDTDGNTISTDIAKFLYLNL